MLTSQTDAQTIFQHARKVTEGTRPPFSYLMKGSDLCRLGRANYVLSFTVASCKLPVGTNFNLFPLKIKGWRVENTERCERRGNMVTSGILLRNRNLTLTLSLIMLYVYMELLVKPEILTSCIYRVRHLTLPILKVG
jgi:hypothetical protein